MQTANQIVSKVLSNVASDGFFHVTESMSFKDYIEICKGMGAVLQVAVLRIVADGDYATLPKSVVFHTDNPQIQIMGWFCASQDSTGGANQLIDLQELSRHLTEGEREILKTVLVDAPNIQTRGRTIDQVPVLSEDKNGRQRLYYTPWLLRRDYNQEQKKVLNKVSSYVADKEKNALIERRLEPGQCLFIDNRRMLHGRGTLKLGSDRCLLRCWINTNSESTTPPGVVNIENFPRDNPLCQGFGRHWFG